jgi:putative toxin-antitoxin system antitoxin component (TIGR02293 family)
MIPASDVAEVMGGEVVLGTDVHSLSDLEAVVSRGLPKQALRHIAQRLFPESRRLNDVVYKVVPEATYKRRSRLTAAESERTERLARVIAAAEYVWDNQADAREWLSRAHPELSGKTPFEAAMTELGARQVEELLAKLFYGLPV